MQRYAVFVLLLALGCDDETATGNDFQSTPPNDTDVVVIGTPDGAEPGTLEGGGGTSGQPFDAAVAPDPGDPVLLSDDAVGIVGVTSDGRVVYRASDGLWAASLDDDGDRELISSEGGTVLIRGNNVFQWTSLDWTTGLGNLSIWSAAHGTRAIGTAIYGDNAAAASLDGSQALYMIPRNEGTANLMLLTDDSPQPSVLIANIGRGDADTCRPSFGFVIEDAVAATCKKGQSGATLVHFDSPVAAAEPTEIATGVRALWSSDWSATRFFYIDEASSAFYWEAGVATEIDQGVAWGMILPEGEAALYTVADQLRRTSVPNMNPTPVVVNEFLVRADWSPDYRHVLFSKELVYGGGTRRDLYLAATDVYNQTPMVLTSEPDAMLSKSSFSLDGRWVVYLTGMNDTGAGILNAEPVDGGQGLALTGVDTAVAARGSLVVYSDDRSDPSSYPITANLNVIHLASGEVKSVREGVSDGRNFFVTPDKGSVVYIMPPGGDPEGEVAGLYVQPLF